MRTTFKIAILLLTAVTAIAVPDVHAQGTQYVRFLIPGTGDTAYGIVDGQNIRELQGQLFDMLGETGRTFRFADVDLLPPVQPEKVIAVGLNYASHIGNQPPPPEPPIFFMNPSSIVGPGDAIIRPSDATELHFEGELVVVIGRGGKNISEANAYDHVFGVTAGNDVSERNWQANDLQWWRAKGADTFGPIGPTILRGVNYDDLLLTTRLNGEVVQQQRTADFIHDISAMVSFISRYVTLKPGDVIFTGTPGATSNMNVGDTIEVEIEGVGVLRNRIAAGE